MPASLSSHRGGVRSRSPPPPPFWQVSLELLASYPHVEAKYAAFVVNDTILSQFQLDPGSLNQSLAGGGGGAGGGSGGFSSRPPARPSGAAPLPQVVDIPVPKLDNTLMILHNASCYHALPGAISDLRQARMRSRVRRRGLSKPACPECSPQRAIPIARAPPASRSR